MWILIRVRICLESSFLPTFFSQEIIFSIADILLMTANLLRFRFRLENLKYFFTLKNVLKSSWWFLLILIRIRIHQILCGSGYNHPDPHHWVIYPWNRMNLFQFRKNWRIARVNWSLWKPRLWRGRRRCTRDIYYSFLPPRRRPDGGGGCIFGVHS